MVQGRVVIGVPTLRRFDTLHKLIESAYSNTVKPDIFFVVDNSCGMFKYRGKHPIIVYTAPFNLGVARSWNLIFRSFPDDFIIISNDDVIFQPITIETIITVAQRESADIVFSEQNGNAFSLFHLNHTTWKELGGFDECFYPAYFEDNDFFYRLKLSNKKIVSAELEYEHVQSGTIKSFSPREMELHHKQFNLNQQYYITKWGGLPHDEVYQTPFNAPVFRAVPSE